jgi:LacI family transcriptional regulator
MERIVQKAGKSKVISQAVIAKKLDVSVGTVSKALRGLPEINRQTCEKVHHLAQSLGYMAPRNSLAQAQKMKGYSLAGVLINSSTYQASRSGYLEGLSNESVRRDFSIFTHYVQQGQCESILSANNLPWVMRQNAFLDGVVFIHKWPEHVVAGFTRQCPCVSIMHEYPDTATDFVGVNNESGIALMMEHLCKKGHSKIGFFGHSKAISWSRGRFSGYTHSLCRYGMNINDEWIIEVEEGYPEAKMHKWERHFDYIAAQVKNGVTAWMCASDLAGYELCKGLSRRGFKIPADVAITGFDSNDDQVFDDFLLTSVKVRSHEMGAAALRLLQTRIQNPEMSRQVMKFDCDFIEGNTI